MINKVNINHNTQYIGAFKIGTVKPAEIAEMGVSSSCDIIKDVGTGDVTFQGEIRFQNYRRNGSRNFWVRIIRDPNVENEQYIIEALSSAPSNPDYTYHNVITAAYDGYSGGADSDTWKVTPPEGEEYYLLYSRM